MPVGVQNPNARMTRDEFLAWDAPGPEHWQLVDGQPVAMAPASLVHGALLAEIGRRLSNHLFARGSGCSVIIAPGVVPRVRDTVNHRIPDLGVTCSPPLEGRVMSDPLVLVEVLSPSNDVAARANVWTYTTIPTVREVLLFHSSRIEAELLQRDERGDWPADALIIGLGGTLELPSLGFAAPLVDFYRTTGLTE